MEHKFTNVQDYQDEWRHLSQEETDVVIVVLDRIMDEFIDRPNVGTINLCGQRRGRSCRDILTMNLSDGPYQRLVSQNMRKTSDDWADESINKIVSWPGLDDYNYKPEALQFGELPTGVYQTGLLRVLVVNTTFGRFIMSFYLAAEKPSEEDERKIEFTEYFDESIMAMKTLAKVLAEMHPEDGRLRQSAFDLTLKAPEKERVMWTDIKRVLDEFNLPELVAWREWRKEMMEEKRIKMFFEN